MLVSRLYSVDDSLLMNMEQLVEWDLAGEAEAPGENPPQRHSVHHKSHMTWPGIEPKPPKWECSN